MTHFRYKKNHQGVVYRFIEKASEGQAHRIDAFTPGQRVWAIVIAASVSLFFELIMIRWQGSLFPVFAFYKNFTLLACFAGLGAGYAASRSARIPLLLVLPVTCVMIVLLILIRYYSGSLYILFFTLPMMEQQSIAGFLPAESIAFGTKFILLLPMYLLLSGVFLFTALIFYPIGQLCGRVMEGSPKLKAYGLNLIGSIAGVLMMVGVSYFWTPPTLWMIFIILALLLFQQFDIKVLRVGIIAGGCIMIALLWPVQSYIQQIYSPYQLIERAAKPDGLMQILSAGKYYQKVYDLSFANQNRDSNEEIKKVRQYYELPFELATKHDKVAIVGSGSGNDVAAALRFDAKHVDAIEIDPVIQYLGKYYHPEKPYSDERVSPIINDARTFFRSAKPGYDLIVYGVLDSHTLLSHASNVRVDSFVYTKEGIEDAYKLLKDGGALSLSFALPVDTMGYKIYQIFKSLPGASKPLALRVGYDSGSTTTFFVSKGGSSAPSVDAARKSGFEDISAQYDKERPDIDIPTDDWPFFYMPKRVYPVSYVGALVLVFALSAFVIHALVGLGKPERGLMPFFFLGAGFMLVETKAITELGLYFGNTWQVIAIVIAGILTMAYGANWAVEKRNMQRPSLAYVFLMLTLAAGYYIATHGKLDAVSPVMYGGLVILLTCPMFFSGIVFSSLLNRSPVTISKALAYNILGALLGGLLEYNSMYFGFAFLYLLAIGLYALAWLTTARS